MLICDAAGFDRDAALMDGAIRTAVFMLGLVLPAYILTIQKAKKKHRLGFGITLAVISTFCYILLHLLGIIVSWAGFAIVCGFGENKESEK